MAAVSCHFLMALAYRIGLELAIAEFPVKYSSDRGVPE
jgi:hypothetical protein